MSQDDVIRHRDLEIKAKDAVLIKNGCRRPAEDVEEEEEEERSRSTTPEMEIESPFFNHVRFSPSAKPGSPARWSGNRSGLRKPANIGRMRLQNVPSEDEQSEFNRQYARDLRSRRRVQRHGEDEVPDDDITPTRKSSRRPAEAGPESMEEEEEDSTPHRTRHSSRIPLRNNKYHRDDDAEDERSEIEDEVKNDLDDNRNDEEEEVDEEEVEETAAAVDSVRSSRSRPAKSQDELSVASEPIMGEHGIRRSSRTPKTSARRGLKDRSSSDDRGKFSKFQ
jgi:hypothetical protein